MSSVIESIERKQLRRRPAFQAGDRVRVHFQVVEGNRKRTQVFDGVVIKIQGNGARETFTVRKQSFGVGVERTFPLHSPKIEKVEVASRGDVRRAKLYYLRDRVGRAARVRERQYTGAEEHELDDMADAQGLQEEAPPEAIVPETGEVITPQPEEEAAVTEQPADEAEPAAADGAEEAAEEPVATSEQADADAEADEDDEVPPASTS